MISISWWCENIFSTVQKLPQKMDYQPSCRDITVNVVWLPRMSVTCSDSSGEIIRCQLAELSGVNVGNARPVCFIYLLI